MFTVYHYPLCPFSRKIRIILSEKQIDFELVVEKYWERRNEFLAMNPSGLTPVLVADEDMVISGNGALFEFLEERFSENPLLPDDMFEKSEARRISEWFDVKFYNEVTKHIINERFIKRSSGQNHDLEPNSSVIRAAKKNLSYHIDYIEYLLQDNNYLCGNRFTVADCVAASHLSVLDFIGDMNWNLHKLKSWYALVKSRPSFKHILEDSVTGLTPPTYYNNPDF